MSTDEEGFSTGKRCFLMSFTDGVGEKERNSTKISQLNLQGLFYLLARRFYILPDVLLFLYLSITAYPSSFSSLAARYLFLVVYCLFFPPFICFTSHLYCITRFEDEDAICRIKYQVTRINGEGRK